MLPQKTGWKHRADWAEKRVPQDLLLPWPIQVNLNLPAGEDVLHADGDREVGDGLEVAAGAEFRPLFCRMISTLVPAKWLATASLSLTTCNRMLL
jgi:hypothetical protein